MIIKEDTNRIKGEVDENGTLYTEEERIRRNEYEDRKDIIRVEAPYCTYVDAHAFVDCRNLQSINLPNCEWIGDDSFYRCSNLSSINLPNCKEIGEGAFLWTPLQDEFE